MLFESLYAAEIGSQERILSSEFFKRSDYMAVCHTPNPKAMGVKDSGSLSLTPMQVIASEQALNAIEPLSRCKTITVNKRWWLTLVS